MAAVAGLRGTGDWSSGERPTNFRESILFMNPNGNTPIFGLTSKVKKRVVDDPEYNWWDEPNDLVRLRVNQSGDIASTVLTITVDSPDPSASALDTNWGLATHLKAGDHLLVEPSTDSATFTNEVIEVTQVISTTQFTCTRGAQGTTPATIPDNACLLLISSAYAEGSGAPSAVTRNPIKYQNKVQIFKDSYELTGTAEVTKTRTGDPWSNDKKRKMFDHARAIEWSMLFGRVSESTAANGKPKRTMAGLRAQIPASRQTIFSVGATTNVSFNHVLDALYRVFDYDTPAGDERIAFVGNVAANTLAKMVAADPNADVQWGGVVKAYGMNLRELILPQGRILLRTHPLLNRHAQYISTTYTPGIYNASMWVLDFSSLEYVTLKGRDTRTRDDVQNKDEDLRRGFVQTDCSLQVDRGGLTCAYLGGLTAANMATS
jgi:hypothetical protein